MNTRVGSHSPLRGNLPDSGDWTRVSCIAGRFFTIWATKKAQGIFRLLCKESCLPHFVILIYFIFNSRRKKGKGEKKIFPATYKILQMLTDDYKRQQSRPRNVARRGGVQAEWMFGAGAREIKLQRGRWLVPSSQPCSVGLQAISSQWERERVCATCL